MRSDSNHCLVQIEFVGNVAELQFIVNRKHQDTTALDDESGAAQLNIIGQVKVP